MLNDKNKMQKGEDILAAKVFRTHFRLREGRQKNEAFFLRGAHAQTPRVHTFMPNFPRISICTKFYTGCGVVFPPESTVFTCEHCF
jgi:hypothetical protein